jgi:hypothetical protein
VFSTYAVGGRRGPGSRLARGTFFPLDGGGAKLTVLSREGGSDELRPMLL